MHAPIGANANSGDHVAIGGNRQNGVQGPRFYFAHPATEQVLTQIHRLAVEPEDSLALRTEYRTDGAANHTAVIAQGKHVRLVGLRNRAIDALDAGLLGPVPREFIARTAN